MTEYIDKAAAVRILEAKSDMEVCTDAQPYFMAAAKMIGLLPSADVAPVRHGRWIASHDEFCACSICKYPVYVAWNQTKYCPNCGAKMFESEDE